MVATAAEAPTAAQRSAAATVVAHTNRSCAAAKPFYWEVGDQHQALAFATEGASAPAASTALPISSASEWIFAAYIVQARGGKMSDSDVRALTMRSGFTNLQYDRCVQRAPGLLHTQSVNNCFHALHLVGGSNSDFRPAQVGKFFFNGGHSQQLAASDPHLGELSAAGLTTLIGATLGTGTAFTYDSPQVDAGIKTTPSSYAQFLRSILSGQLLIRDQLGSNAICTNPARCAMALNTPMPLTEISHYSLGHWVEDDPRVGDGAFSDPGLLGFYPWIDGSKAYYGLLARVSRAPGAYVISQQCGRLIRRAWLTGKTS